MTDDRLDQLRRRYVDKAREAPRPADARPADAFATTLRNVLRLRRDVLVRMYDLANAPVKGHA